MTAEQELLALERAFWSEIADTDFYRAHITDNAVMVFPAPYGIMEYDAILEAVEGATRWEECTFSDFQLVELTDDSAVVAYRADARRPNGPTYAAVRRLLKPLLFARGWRKSLTTSGIYYLPFAQPLAARSIR